MDDKTRMITDDDHPAADTDSTNLPPPTTAPPGTRLVDPFEMFAQTEGGSTFFEGDYIQLNGQTGAWSRGFDKEPIGATTSFLCNMNELHVGWIKMVDGKTDDRRIGRVFDGYQRPPRETLGDLDERRWPFNRKGEREDPWKEAIYLPMRCLDDGESVVFAPLNMTGRRELAKFIKVYCRANRKGRYPVVSLETRSFENQSGGQTYVPVFRILGWEFWDGEPAPTPAPVQVPIAPAAAAPPQKALAAPDKTRPDDDSFSDTDDEILF